MSGCIELSAPAQTDREREHEAGEVQAPPRLQPGQRQDAGIEQGVVGEQLDVTACSGRGQYGRGKPAGGRDHRQRRSVLAHGEYCSHHHHGEHQCEYGAGGQQCVQPQCREGAQVEEGNRAALQAQRIAARTLAQVPADGAQCQAEHGDAAQTQGRRQGRVLDRVACQKGEAEEQHQQADPHQCVATKQPVAAAAVDRVEVERALLLARHRVIAGGLRRGG
ncbi:hypothetical protein SDC9_169066 [bioreactor metagenome]|uniref:Uncharacterized protein n=1 Tax=bioreactor metagenome TaxID=1076179 RepID=A0A645G6C8_9ZZZZ